MLGGGSIDGCCGDPCPDWTEDFGTTYPRRYKIRLNWDHHFCPPMPGQEGWTPSTDIYTRSLQPTYLEGTCYCGHIVPHWYCTIPAEWGPNFCDHSAGDGIHFYKENGQWYANIRTAFNYSTLDGYTAGPLDMSDLTSITLDNLRKWNNMPTRQWTEIESLTLTAIDNTCEDNDCECNWFIDMMFDYDRCESETPPEHGCCFIATYSSYLTATCEEYPEDPTLNYTRGSSGSVVLKPNYPNYGPYHMIGAMGVGLPDSPGTNFTNNVSGGTSFYERCGHLYLFMGTSVSEIYGWCDFYPGVGTSEESYKNWLAWCADTTVAFDLGEYPISSMSFPYDFTWTGSRDGTVWIGHQWSPTYDQVTVHYEWSAGCSITGFGTPEQCEEGLNYTPEMPCGATVTNCIVLLLYGVCGDRRYSNTLFLSWNPVDEWWESGIVTTPDGEIEVIATVDEECLLSLYSMTYLGEHYRFELQIEESHDYTGETYEISNAVSYQEGDTRYITKLKLAWEDRYNCKNINNSIQSANNCDFCEGSSFIVDTLRVKVPGSTLAPLQGNLLEKTDACRWENNYVAGCNDSTDSFSIDVTGNKDGCEAYWEATVTKNTTDPVQWVKYRKTFDVRTEKVDCFGEHTLTEYSRSGTGEIPECGSTFVIEQGAKTDYTKPQHLSEVHSQPWYVHVRLVDPEGCEEDVIYDIPISGLSDDDHWIFHYGPGYITPECWSNPPLPCLSGEMLYGDIEIKYSWLDFYCLLMEFTLTATDHESNECSLYCKINITSLWEICSGDEFQCGDFYISIDPAVNWMEGHPCVLQPYAT